MKLMPNFISFFNKKLYLNQQNFTKSSVEKMFPIRDSFNRRQRANQSIFLEREKERVEKKGAGRDSFFFF